MKMLVNYSYVTVSSEVSFYCSVTVHLHSSASDIIPYSGKISRVAIFADVGF